MKYERFYVRPERHGLRFYVVKRMYSTNEIRWPRNIIKFHHEVVSRHFTWRAADRRVRQLRAEAGITE